MSSSNSTLRAQVTSLRLVRERTVEYETRIHAANDVYTIVKPLIADMAQEVFLVLGLNIKNQINVIHQIGMGCADSVTINPGDIAKVLLLSHSSRCIICHNHPANDVEPSNEDFAITKRVKEICSLIGVQLLDHIIVAEHLYHSFAASKMLL